MRVTVLSGYGAYSGFGAPALAKKLQTVAATIRNAKPPTTRPDAIKYSAGLKSPTPNAPGAAALLGGNGGVPRTNLINFPQVLSQRLRQVLPPGPNMTTQPAPATTTLPTTLPLDILNRQLPVAGQLDLQQLYTSVTQQPTPQPSSGQTIPVVAPYEITPAQPFVAEDQGLAAGEPAPGGLPGWVLPAAGVGLLAVGAMVWSRHRGSGSMNGYRGKHGRRR